MNINDPLNDPILDIHHRNTSGSIAAAPVSCNTATCKVSVVIVDPNSRADFTVKDAQSFVIKANGTSYMFNPATGEWTATFGYNDIGDFLDLSDVYEDMSEGRQSFRSIVGAPGFNLSSFVSTSVDGKGALKDTGMCGVMFDVDENTDPGYLEFTQGGNPMDWITPDALREMSYGMGVRRTDTLKAFSYCTGILSTDDTLSLLCSAGTALNAYNDEWNDMYNNAGTGSWSADSIYGSVASQAAAVAGGYACSSNLEAQMIQQAMNELAGISNTAFLDNPLFEKGSGAVINIAGYDIGTIGAVTVNSDAYNVDNSKLWENQVNKEPETGIYSRSYWGGKDPNEVVNYVDGSPVTRAQQLELDITGSVITNIQDGYYNKVTMDRDNYTCCTSDVFKILDKDIAQSTWSCSYVKATIDVPGSAVNQAFCEWKDATYGVPTTKIPSTDINNTDTTKDSSSSSAPSAESISNSQKNYNAIIDEISKYESLTEEEAGKVIDYLTNGYGVNINDSTLLLDANSIKSLVGSAILEGFSKDYTSGSSSTSNWFTSLFNTDDVVSNSGYLGDAKISYEDYAKATTSYTGLDYAINNFKSNGVELTYKQTDDIRQLAEDTQNSIKNYLNIANNIGGSDYVDSSKKDSVVNNFLNIDFGTTNGYAGLEKFFGSSDDELMNILELTNGKQGGTVSAIDKINQIMGTSTNQDTYEYISSNSNYVNESMKNIYYNLADSTGDSSYSDKASDTYSCYQCTKAGTLIDYVSNNGYTTTGTQYGSTEYNTAKDAIAYLETVKQVNDKAIFSSTFTGEMKSGNNVAFDYTDKNSPVVTIGSDSTFNVGGIVSAGVSLLAGGVGLLGTGLTAAINGSSLINGIFSNGTTISKINLNLDVSVDKDGYVVGDKYTSSLVATKDVSGITGAIYNLANMISDGTITGSEYLKIKSIEDITVGAIALYNTYNQIKNIESYKDQLKDINSQLGSIDTNKLIEISPTAGANFKDAINQMISINNADLSRLGKVEGLLGVMGIFQAYGVINAVCSSIDAFGTTNGYNGENVNTVGSTYYPNSGSSPYQQETYGYPVYYNSSTGGYDSLTGSCRSTTQYGILDVIPTEYTDKVFNTANKNIGISCNSRVGSDTSSNVNNIVNDQYNYSCNADSSVVIAVDTTCTCGAITKNLFTCDTASVLGLADSTYNKKNSIGYIELPRITEMYGGKVDNSQQFIGLQQVMLEGYTPYSYQMLTNLPGDASFIKSVIK